MIGDGKCDRFCNHQWQDFDGFDCCLDFISPAESCECVSLNQGKAQFSNVHGEQKLLRNDSVTFKNVTYMAKNGSKLFFNLQIQTIN